jgi:hypothetical protein
MLLQPDHGWLPRNLRVAGKRDLISILQGWLADSSAPTVGDTRRYHGAFWVTAEIGGHKVRLAADTTREAVQQVVDELSGRPDVPWRVIRNQRGQVTKVQATSQPIVGWYAYVHPALPQETSI